MNDLIFALFIGNSSVNQHTIKFKQKQNSVNNTNYSSKLLNSFTLLNSNKFSKILIKIEQNN